MFDWLFKPNIEKLKAKRDAPELIKILVYKDYYLRRSAAEALGQLGDPRAVEPLITSLKYEYDWHLRKAAAAALGQIGDPRALEPLTAALEDREPPVRTAAAAALEELNMQPGKDALENTDRPDEG